MAVVSIVIITVAVVDRGRLAEEARTAAPVIIVVSREQWRGEQGVAVEAVQ